MRLGLQLAFAGLVAVATSHFAIAAEPPKFQIDTSWPKTLPNHWIVGQIGGIFVDSKDHIWITHRPGTLTDREKRGGATPSVRCCVSAPPVIEFDQEGNVVQAWGGPGGNNVVADPRLNLHLITNTATANAATVRAALRGRR